MRFFILCFVYFTTVLAAQEITRIAVLDYEAVLEEFSNRNFQQQRISELRAETSQEMEKLKKQLAQLQKEQSKVSGQKARRLEEEMQKLREYGIEYVEDKNAEIRKLQSMRPDIQQILPGIISQIAREQGYSVIVNRRNQGIIWFDVSIDITETVIQRLRKRLKV